MPDWVTAPQPEEDMIDMRVCRRQMPFGEHRTMAEVIEAEYLLSKRIAGKRLSGGEAQRLAGLLNRDPTPYEPPPPRSA
jgi:hypothetical protein